MLADARNFADRTVISTDICIVGAGPAGITLARELESTRLRICVIESGGSKGSDSEHTLPLASLSSDLRPGPRTRGHGIGGTAYRWNYPLPAHQVGVRLIPMRAIDFEERDWVPHSGWPFNLDHLADHYSRARESCGLGPYLEDPRDWVDSSHPPLPLDPSRITTTIDDVRLAAPMVRNARELLKRSRNTTVILHSTALALEERPASSSIQRLRIACLNGRTHTVDAQIFVIACGGIENARLLLLSNARHPAGIGNQRDLVGRYFMDHLFVGAGTIVPASAALFDASGLYSLRRARSSLVQGRLRLTEQAVRAERLLQSIMLLTPKPPGAEYAALQSLKHLYYSARTGRIQAPLAALRGGLPALPYIVSTGGRMAVQQRRLLPSTHAGWAGLKHRSRRFETFHVELQIELAPCPANRVVLSNQRDAWGRPTAGVQWRWGDLDRRSVRRTGEILDEELRRAGLGRFEAVPVEELQYDEQGTHHHMGTTRMHVDPARGVVDGELRVHGVDNLFVAGSSVFPTGSYVNPTLTIIALSIRLADEIKRRVKERATITRGHSGVQ